jgi:hypothetical protein
MSAKDRISPKLSFRQGALPIIILCMSVWAAPPETLAQQATSAALDMAEPSTPWSFDAAVSNKTPYLVLGMADRGDTPFYGLGTAGSEVRNPPAEDELARRNNPATSMNRTGKVGPDALMSSNLFDSNVGRGVLANLGAKPTKPGSFTYPYQPNYLAPEQRLANEEPSTRAIVQPPRPFFELEFGNWRLPVKLSGTESQAGSAHRW